MIYYKHKDEKKALNSFKKKNHKKETKLNMGGAFLSTVYGNLEVASILLVYDMNGHPRQNASMGNH